MLCCAQPCRRSFLDTGILAGRPDRLWVNPDCGLKTRGWPETTAALANMVQAARELRQEWEAGAGAGVAATAGGAAATAGGGAGGGARATAAVLMEGIVSCRCCA